MGAVHVPLRRLARRGYPESWQGNPTPERGGRARKFYRLTDQGVAALSRVRALTEDAGCEIPSEAYGLTLETSS